jgi:uncharacterized protein (DUF58 family)
MSSLAFVLFGVLIFFAIILLTLVLGAVSRRAAVNRFRETAEDIAKGQHHDVTVTPRPNDPWIRSPDDRLPQS